MEDTNGSNDDDSWGSWDSGEDDERSFSFDRLLDQWGRRRKRQVLGTISQEYDDVYDLCGLELPLTSRFHDGHEHCSHLFQGAFLYPQEDMRWFWHPVTDEEDIGDTDDESDDGIEEEDNNTVFEHGDLPKEYENNVKPKSTATNVVEHELGPEDYIRHQESFERSLYEDFRLHYDELRLQELVDQVEEWYRKWGHEWSQEQVDNLWSSMWERWRERMAKRKEWFDEAMVHKFSKETSA